MKNTFKLFLVSLITISTYSQKKLERVTFEYNCNFSIYKNELGNQYPEKKYYFIEFEDPKELAISKDDFDNSPLGSINISSKDISFDYGIKYMKTESNSDYYVVVRDSRHTGMNVIIIIRKKGIISGLKYDVIMQLASVRDLNFGKPVFFENYYLKFKDKRELFSEPYIEKDNTKN
jgi:hypothetical protein